MITGDIFNPPRNFAALRPPFCDFETARVALLLMAYDGTAEYRALSRTGPQAIIEASQDLELFDAELGREVHQVGIHTLPDLQPAVAGPEHAIERVRQAAGRILDAGKMPVLLGGEHSLSLGMVQALHQRYPDLSVLHLDAHTDLRQEYLGSRYSYASVMRRVAEVCPLVQVGVRSLSQEEHLFLSEKGMRPFFAHDLALDEAGLGRIVSGLSPHVYITVDLDVFDPSIMAAVGCPEPGGLTWRQVLAVLRAACARRQVVAFDVMELCPKEGPAACAFTAAKLVYKLIGYVTEPR